MDFLLWLPERPGDYAEELVTVMQYKESMHKQPDVISDFCCSSDAVLRELGTQQIRQMVRESVVACAHTLKDIRIKELVAFLIRNHMVSVTLGNRCGFR